jgi:hypothetical protein
VPKTSERSQFCACSTRYSATKNCAQCLTLPSSDHSRAFIKSKAYRRRVKDSLRAAGNRACSARASTKESRALSATLRHRTLSESEAKKRREIGLSARLHDTAHAQRKRGEARNRALSATSRHRARSARARRKREIALSATSRHRARSVRATRKRNIGL